MAVISKYDFLKMVPLFAGMPEDDLRQLCAATEEVGLQAGELLFREGSPGHRAYVIQQGELEILKESSGRHVLLAVRVSGEVIGEVALLEEVPRTATVRARTPATLLAIDKAQLDLLLTTSPSAARAMLETVLARWRATASLLRQSEKMAQLGTLTAGVAHELNNPAAAVSRGAGQLQQEIAAFQQAVEQLSRQPLSAAQQRAVAALGQELQRRAARPEQLDALTRSDREFALETWLEEQGLENGWELAPTLVGLGYEPLALAGLLNDFAGEKMPAVVAWLAAAGSVYSLLSEIGQGAGRIADIVKALKSYAYLDQAPVQAVDIHEGLDNTLLILRSKLKSGISVRRDYAPDLPLIQGYGSELNQVWTNLLDNAIDALEGQGEIVIRTRQVEDWVVVEIADNGPGIPPEIISRIFDPFFTTKPPGKGTGLGLDISYNIVVHKHRGEIKVYSHPGWTCFQVSLPVNFEDAGNKPIPDAGVPAGPSA